jgi:hypothetical protein
VKTRLGTVIVTVLAILGAIAGFLGTSAYFSYVGASNGFRAVCQTLRTGEAKQLISKAQRVEMATRSVPVGKGDELLVAYFMSDCSKPLFQFVVDGGQR